MFGSPGRISGLALRCAQWLFAAASIGVMVTASGFFNSTAFWLFFGGIRAMPLVSVLESVLSILFVSLGYELFESRTMQLLFYYKVVVLANLNIVQWLSYLIASMGLQILWSFGLACLDLHALRMKKNLRNSVLLCLFAIGDWVVATLSLAAASSSAGVTILYSRDLDYCRSPPHLPCTRLEVSVAFAFISWFLLAISSLVTFWLLGTV